MNETSEQLTGDWLVNSLELKEPELLTYYYSEICGAVRTCLLSLISTPNNDKKRKVRR